MHSPNEDKVTTQSLHWYLPQLVKEFSEKSEWAGSRIFYIRGATDPVFGPPSLSKA